MVQADWPSISHVKPTKARVLDFDTYRLEGSVSHRLPIRYQGQSTRQPHPTARPDVTCRLSLISLHKHVALPGTSAILNNLHHNPSSTRTSGTTLTALVLVPFSQHGQRQHHPIATRRSRSRRHRHIPDGPGSALSHQASRRYCRHRSPCQSDQKKALTCRPVGKETQA